MPRFALFVAIAALVALLSGCTPAPEHVPTDADVVAAREEAYDELPDLTRLTTDAAMTRIADHFVDACGTAHSQQGIIGHEELGLRCTVSGAAVFALGTATDAASAAAAVDAFVAANGATTATTMLAEVQASPDEFGAPPSLGTGYDSEGNDIGGPYFAVTLYNERTLAGNVQYLPKNAGGGVVRDQGDWPLDVESTALATGAGYFVVVESFLEYYNSDVTKPTYGSSDLGDSNHNPPCYGTSGYCPGG